MIIVGLMTMCWIAALVIFVRHNRRIAKRSYMVGGLLASALMCGALGIVFLTVFFQAAFRDGIARDLALIGTVSLFVTSVAAAIAGLLRLSQESHRTGNEPPQNPRS